MSPSRTSGGYERTLQAVADALAALERLMTSSELKADELAILRGIAESSMSLVVDLDTRKILRASHYLEQLFGYGPGSLVGHSVDVLIPPELREVHERHFAEYAAAPVPRQMGQNQMELIGFTKAGERLRIEVLLWPRLVMMARTLVFATIIPRRA